MPASEPPTAKPAIVFIEKISDAVGGILKEKWKLVNKKNVAWEIPFEGNFHIDVVPGRALDKDYYYANLYKKDSGQPLKTSLKKHIDTIRNADRRNAIKLVKYWNI